jgi:hypothetical protein
MPLWLPVNRKIYLYKIANKSETGHPGLRCKHYNITIMSHVKNVEAFTRVVDFCTGFGGNYNPGRPTLQIDALATQLSHIQSAMDHVRIAKAEYDRHVVERKQAFDQIPKLLAGTLRRLEASGTKPEYLENARAHVHRFIGASPKTRSAIPSEQVESAPGPKGHLQLAYVSKADAFSKLVQSLKTEPLYQSREPLYTVEGLEAKVLELMLLNQAVADARKLWRMALIDRDKVLYSNEESMLQVARAVKKYVRGLYGHDSREYALLKEWQFLNT